MNYEKQPLGWAVEENEFNPMHIAKCESIFAQGNGYINLRCALEEDYTGQRRGTFITGTFNKAMPDEVTELPNLPDVAGLRMLVNNERVALSEGALESYSRTLYLRTGEVVRKVRWKSPGGVGLELCFRRFVSLENEHLAAFLIEITPLNTPVTLILESGIDSRGTNTGAQHFLEGNRRLLDGDILRLCTRTGQSNIPVAVHCLHRFSLPAESALPVMERRRFVNRYTFSLEPGQTLEMEKLACYHTGRDQAFVSFGLSGTTEERLVSSAGDTCIRTLRENTYRELLELSSGRWEQYWAKNDVLIESSSPFDQLGIRFALYHLNIMIKRDDNRVGIGAKGMTGEGYKGHSFWDTEMFLLPHYLLTDPASARTLLEYRWRTLPGAYKKAEENGYQGAMFPWESAWLDDGEVTPLYGAADVVTGESIPILTGQLEHHITADIAWAVWLYYRSTGDDEFMERYGCELLIETARFWSSRLEWKPETARYEICNVIGPDEYKEHVDNNAFTNYLAAYNLERACDIIAQMRERWPAAYAMLSGRYSLEALHSDFREKRGKLYLPQPGKNGIVPQNAQYLRLEEIDLGRYRAQQGVSSIYEDHSPAQMNRMMVSKQADLVMLLRVFPTLFDDAVRRKNFLFYETHTLHDSSLSHGQHCILAAWMGMGDMALEFYRHAIAIDLGPTPHSSDEGIHSASMGNIWQCAICGFAGVEWQGEALALSNNLPKEWRGLQFRITWRGAQLAVELTHDCITVTHISGPSVQLLIGGRRWTLVEGSAITTTGQEKQT